MRRLGGRLRRVEWRDCVSVGSVGRSNCELHGGTGTERGTLQHKNQRFLTSTRPLEVLM